LVVAETGRTRRKEEERKLSRTEMSSNRARENWKAHEQHWVEIPYRNCFFNFRWKKPEIMIISAKKKKNAIVNFWAYNFLPVFFVH
jgi:hypothetical protein